MATQQTVAVYIQRAIDPERRLLATLPREKLIKHSASFEAFLSGYEVENEDRREISLPTGAPMAYKHVFGIMKAHGGKQDLFVNVAGMGTPRTIAIWEVCNILGLKPELAMSRLTAFLCWSVSHEKVTPDVMERIHTVFRPSNHPEDEDKCRPWHTMIHQYVWDLIHAQYAPEEQRALELTYAPIPELGNAIAEKEDELRAKKALHDKNQSFNQQRRGGTKHQQKKALRKELKALGKDGKMRKRAEEVKAGLRAWTPELDAYIKDLDSYYEMGKVHRRETSDSSGQSGESWE